MNQAIHQPPHPPQPHQPVVGNTEPIEVHTQLPPHRVSICPPTTILGLSHQNLLVAIHEVLTGEYRPVSGSWFSSLVNEAIYRGLLYQTIHGMPACAYANRYPATLEGFTQEYSLRDGFGWVPEQRQAKK